MLAPQSTSKPIKTLENFKLRFYMKFTPSLLQLVCGVPVAIFTLPDILGQLTNFVAEFIHGLCLRFTSNFPSLEVEKSRKFFVNHFLISDILRKIDNS